MKNNRYKSSLKATALILLMMAATLGFSDSLLIELSRTIEEARITVESNNNKSSGTLTATMLECSTCTPQEYTFDANTRLLNQFGDQKPIEELQSWSGNRAMFHFRKTDNHIEQLEILP